MRQGRAMLKWGCESLSFSSTYCSTSIFFSFSNLHILSSHLYNFCICSQFNYSNVNFTNSITTLLSSQYGTESSWCCRESGRYMPTYAATNLARCQMIVWGERGEQQTVWGGEETKKKDDDKKREEQKVRLWRVNNLLRETTVHPHPRLC